MKSSRAKIMAVAAAILMAISIIGTSSGVEEVHYFPETSHTIKGRFFAYWQAHGGLQQQGYPITEELTERNESDGKSYTVQYFERAVFEYHPENQSPYDVLLSQLGTLRYNERYGANAPNQRSSTENPYFFPKSGHTIGGAFRTYWEQYGGLMQFGYPISEEFQERSDLTGKTYKVQYFERAVFEWHPENQVPYEVLLTQLGTLRYREKYNGGKSPAPQMVASTVVGNVVGIGRQLYWLDSRSGGSSIYGYDLDRKQEFVVTNEAAGDLTVDQSLLVWLVAPGNDHLMKVRSYDPVSRKQATIGGLEFGGDTFEGFPAMAVTANTIYYVAARNGIFAALYAHDLTTGVERMISPYGRDPVARDGILLWKEVTYPHRSDQTSLHVLHIGSNLGSVTILDQEGCAMGYDVSADNIVWSLDCTAIDQRVYLYNLSSRLSEPISSTSSRTLSGYPVISGNIVAWTNLPSGNPGETNSWSVSAYDTNTKVVTLVARSDTTELHTWAIIDGQAVAYTQFSWSGGKVLYIANLN